MKISNRLALPLTNQSHFAAIQQTLPQNHHGGLSIAAYGSAIQCCADRRLLRQGKQLHARLFLFSITPSNFLGSKLVTFYSKCNLMHYARKVFDEIPSKNSFSWNAMLMGYSFNGMFHKSLDLFYTLSLTQMTCIDNFTITCILKAISSLFCSSNSVKEVHCFVIRGCLDRDVFVMNALITCYSRCGQVVVARKLFDRMPERDTVSWNSMIAGYSQGGFYEECKRLYLEMLGVPDAVTVATVMQACGQSNDLVFGMEIHQMVNDSGMKMDMLLCNAVIAMYAKCGSLDYAQELFDEMSEKDEVTYGSMISGYMSYGFVDKAMAVFREMERPGLSNWNAVISGMVQNNQYERVLDLVQEMQAFGSWPNAVTLASILPSFSYFSNLRGGKEVHAYAVRRCYVQNIYVATAIIDTYAKLGFIHGAQKVFDQSQSRNLIIWTAIITAHAAHGDSSLALGLYARMLDKGIQPDPVTITAVLTACSHSGLVDEAWNIFNSMPSKCGMQPLVEQYACMFVCDRLFEIEPENTGNYIIMSNLYSRHGRWEEADMIRDRLKGIGLQKIRGSSWIETSRGLLSFIAKDVSHERSDEIYALLEGLLGLMREEGYVLQEELDYETPFG
ncbi:hypothetical protein PIB30_017466 [Stylosanthes scabra]|uniref:Chlororespiratory reduction 21 n=3 Tax=Stylosanthes scabra TaxID=79078 RepID=A0ABU6Z6M2_9FABA|nr:hypothetical protein [Stylosanthes scabra]